MATHWKKLSNPNFLGSWDFEDGEERIFTINSIGNEDVFNPSTGRKDECIVIHFFEKVKPFISNATNCKMITKCLETPDTERWIGKRIKVHVEKVKLKGELVDALRVMKWAGKCLCSNCQKEITSKDGYTVESIIKASKEKYNTELCLDCGKERGNATKSQ